MTKDTPRLTHIDTEGRPRMVDIADKPITNRMAVAIGCLRMKPETLRLSMSGATLKGSPIRVAEIAGVMAAKRTADLIPLCHPLPLTSVLVEIEPADDGEGMIVQATCKTTGQTGVEMEALTAASVALLTLYDMLKAADKGMVIDGVKVVEKVGGRSDCP